MRTHRLSVAAVLLALIAGAALSACTCDAPATKPSSSSETTQPPPEKTNTAAANLFIGQPRPPSTRGVDNADDGKDVTQFLDRRPTEKFKREIDLTVEDADLRDTMNSIGRRNGRNVVVGPDVDEHVTISLRKIPWRDAVDVTARGAHVSVDEPRIGAILKQHDYFYKKYEKSAGAEAAASGTAERPLPTTPDEMVFEATRQFLTTPEARTRAPALLARPEGPEQKELPLEAMRVASVLMSTRARVLIDCTFGNPYPHTLEGTLMVRLPEGASACSLGMFQGAGPRDGDAKGLLPPAIDEPDQLLGTKLALPSHWSAENVSVDWGNLRQAVVVGETQGRMVYEQVTRRRIDPALMEWSGGNNFSTRIFPIPAHGRKRVFFAYDVPPIELGDRVGVLLPVPLKLPSAFRIEATASRRAYDDAKIVSGNHETALTPQIDVAPGSPADALLSASVVPTGETGEGSFLLAARPRTSVRAGYGQGVKDGCQVHARLRPETTAVEGSPTGTAVFVLDTSRSQKAKLGETCGRLLRAILEKDATIERFRVVTFDVTARELFSGARANTPEDREKTLAEIEKLWLEGATSFEAALACLDATIPTTETPTYFLLSDAQLTWGIDDGKELERAFPRLMTSHWICYQIGDAAVNRAIFERLTRSGGRVVSVVSAQDLDSAAVAHRTRPVMLKQVSVEGLPARDVIVAGDPHSIFPGETLEVGFRTARGDDPRKATIVLETEAGKQSFSLENAVFDPIAARAWAELTTTSLLELGDRDADQVALALSQRFGLANRVASFLILETDVEYDQHELKPEDLDLARLAEVARQREAGRPVGGPDVAPLDSNALAFIDSLANVSATPWLRPSSPAHEETIERPTLVEPLDPTTVHREAERCFRAGGNDALRVLSAIVEENPRDASVLRLAGFTLMSWGCYEDAAAIFARVRRLRPFEPQALLCEGLAFEAQGRTRDAALRYELLLAGTFDQRHGQYTKAATCRAYGRLLLALGKPGEERAAKLTLTSPSRGLLPLPMHEVHLLWNLDDCDIDLRVQEAGATGVEVSYENLSSRGGGRLWWDNTTGLGPEIYTHPTNEPATVSVDYYGNRSVGGTVPAATMIVYWRSGVPTCRATVLPETKSRIVVWSAKSD